jgi:spermidine/putrescine transport system ATP-binding protein
MTDGAHAIELADVTKVYDSGGRRPGDTAAAVSGASFQIAEGEFFSMLGPSGCGKSTTLRMLAGFEQPTSGRLFLRGADVTDVPPARRDVNMVFQAYALFPHMTVAENIAFGLRVRKVARRELRERVDEALASVRLEGMGERKPTQLSGGQQQRVALARALVNRPAALLLDEPLGALDLKLRKEMQLELKAIQARSEITFVYVTHDQEEALTMSDRIAVMNGGVIEQIATPRELYERPRTPFVAGFIGTSNLVHMKIDDCVDGHGVMRLGDRGQIVAPRGERAPGDEIQVTVRPEKISVAPFDDDPNCSRVTATVADTIYLGSMVELIVQLDSGERLAVRRTDVDEVDAFAPGDPITIYWRARHAWVVASGAPATVGAPA